MNNANFITPPAQMQEHQAITFIWFKENEYFVLETEGDICPWHKTPAVLTMMGFYQCPECAKKHLEIIKKQQQPLVDMAVAEWERRQTLTDAQRQEEDRVKREEWKRSKRRETFSYSTK